MTESSHYTYLKLAMDENARLGLQLESMIMEDSLLMHMFCSEEMDAVFAEYSHRPSY